MSKLIYSATTSLDGYIADQAGKFDWTVPDEEVHTFINQLVQPVGTHLYGRRLYQVMAAWETMDTSEEPPYVREFAEIWRAADKIVYSRTLESVSSARTRLEREFDPEAIRELKARATDELLVGGAELAGQAIKAGLVDEYHCFVAPVIVGGGTRFLPERVRVELQLVQERRFADGRVYLRYRQRY